VYVSDVYLSFLLLRVRALFGTGPVSFWKPCSSGSTSTVFFFLASRGCEVGILGYGVVVDY
jgi:hypothetical protein